jgi:(2R)-3-sulfolactate dehydrogenase (NADP+)
MLSARNEPPIFSWQIESGNYFVAMRLPSLDVLGALGPFGRRNAVPLAILLLLCSPQRLLRRQKPPPPALDVLTVPEERLLALSTEALVDAGLGAAPAALVAASLVAAQRDGRESHGLGRLPAVARSLREGRVSASAKPALRRGGPRGVVRVDAGGGLVQPALALALPELARAARRCGVACLALDRVGGIVGSLAGPLEALAADGLVAFACCNSPALMAAHGGKNRVFGTNPLGFGWPRADAEGSSPLVVDLATAAVARGELQALQRRGLKLPAGAALTVAGEPTTDAALGLAGAQLPFGGHKGSALALVVELLSAGLCGTDLAIDAPTKDECGAQMNRGLFFWAVDPAAFGGADALAAGERLIARLRAEEGVRLPSDARHAARAAAAARGGIEVSASVLDECFGPGILQTTL